MLSLTTGGLWRSVWKHHVVLLAVLIVLSSCAERRTSTVDSELKTDLTALQSGRIYFGHQSVGGNILDGLTALSKEAGTPLNISSPNAVTVSSGFFAESALGRNSEPATKCVAFHEQIEKMHGEVDIALMKLCYIDFDANTQPGEIFEHYVRAVQAVHHQYPSITIVHVTVPLKVSSSGIKRIIKDILGRPDQARLANLRRCQFNNLLKQRFYGEPVFDLAAVESTGPDGQQNSFAVDGQSGLSLAPEYTSDGGHLNDHGARVVARELVRVLAAAARHKQGRRVAAGHVRRVLER